MVAPSKPNNRAARRKAAQAIGLKGQLVSALVVVTPSPEHQPSKMVAAAVVTALGMLVEKGGDPLVHCSIIVGNNHPSYPGEIVVEARTDKMQRRNAGRLGEPIMLSTTDIAELSRIPLGEKKP